MAKFGIISGTGWDRTLKPCSTLPKPTILRQLEWSFITFSQIEAEISLIQVLGPCPKRAWPKNGFPHRKFLKLFFWYIFDLYAIGLNPKTYFTIYFTPMFGIALTKRPQNVAVTFK